MNMAVRGGDLVEYVPVDLLGLEPGLCKWPLGQPGSDAFRYCGNPRVHEQTSYCRGHHLIAYPASDCRPKRKMRPAGAVEIAQAKARDIFVAPEKKRVCTPVPLRKNARTTDVSCETALPADYVRDPAAYIADVRDRLNRGITKPSDPVTLEEAVEQEPVTVPQFSPELIEAARRAAVGWNSAAIIRRIIQDTAKAFGLSPRDLTGPRRFNDFVQARSIAMWLVRRTRRDLSFPRIGQFFGRRDHTTVLWAVKKINEQWEAGALVLPEELQSYLQGEQPA